MRFASIVLALYRCVFASSDQIAFAADKPTEKPNAMPAEKPDAKPRVIRVVLKSTPKGELSEMIVDGKVIEPSKDGKKTRYDILRAKTMEMVFDEKGIRRPDEVEIEIDADDTLRYENIIHTVEAVSGRIGPNGKFEQLVKTVRFGPKDEGDDDSVSNFNLPKPKAIT